MKNTLYILFCLLSINMAAQQVISRDNANGNQYNKFYGWVEAIKGLKVPKAENAVVPTTMDSLGLLRMNNGVLEFHNSNEWASVGDRKDYRLYNIEWAGAKPNDTINDWAFIEQAYANAQDQGYTGVYFPEGVWKTKNQINATMTTIGAGKDRTFIDASEGVMNIPAGGDSDFPNYSVMVADGGIEEVGKLIDSVLQSQNLLSLDDLKVGLSEGDILIIQNLTDGSNSGNSPVNRQGQHTRVRAFDTIANTITITEPVIPDFFPSDTTRVYRIRRTPMEISGMTFIGNSPASSGQRIQSGLRVFWHGNIKISDIEANNYHTSAVGLYGCYMPEVSGLYNIRKENVPSTTTAYTLDVSCCTMANIHHNTLFSDWHAITSGENLYRNYNSEGSWAKTKVSFPSRYNDFHNNIIMCDVQRTNSHAFDFHTQADDCYIHNNFIVGGISVGGDGHRIYQNDIYPPDAYDQAKAAAFEFEGYNAQSIYIYNNDIKSSNKALKLFEFLGTNYLRPGGVIRFYNNDITAASAVPLFVDFQDASNNTTMSYLNIDMTGNTIRVADNSNNPLISLIGKSGNNIGNITFRDNDISGVSLKVNYADKVDFGGNTFSNTYKNASVFRYVGDLKINGNNTSATNNVSGTTEENSIYSVRDVTDLYINGNIAKAGANTGNAFYLNTITNYNTGINSYSLPDSETSITNTIAYNGLSDTSGFVPYTGATADVDLGSNGLTANDVTVGPAGDPAQVSIVNPTAPVGSSLYLLRTESSTGKQGLVVYEGTDGGIHVDNRIGRNSTAFGNRAGLNNVDSVSPSNDGVQNAFFGSFAGWKNTTGHLNTFIGNSAGQNNTTGTSNAYFGNLAGSETTTGSRNIAFGSQAGRSLVTGQENVFIGFSAGYNTVGNSNIHIGTAGIDPDDSFTTGSGNVLIGNYPNLTEEEREADGQVIIANGSGQRLLYQDANGDVSLTGNSFTFSNIPIVGTASPLDFSDKAASTAYADSKVSNSLVDGENTIAPSQNAVYDALTLKADDANVVHKSGTETITGSKTFSAATMFNDMITVASSNQPAKFERTTTGNSALAAQSIKVTTTAQMTDALSVGIVAYGQDADGVENNWGNVSWQRNGADNSTKIAFNARNAGSSVTTFTADGLGNLNIPALTASQIVGTDASKNLVSLSTSTYPSLSELAFVKGVTSGIQAQMNLKAPLASPALTGSPTSSTALTGDNSTRIATTAFVQATVTQLTAYTAKTSSYSLTSTDFMVDLTSGTATFTLPTALGISGRQYIVKNSGTGVLTLGTASSQTIDGTTSMNFTVQYSGCRVISDGANWKIIGMF